MILFNGLLIYVLASLAFFMYTKNQAAKIKKNKSYKIVVLGSKYTYIYRYRISHALRLQKHYDLDNIYATGIENIFNLDNFYESHHTLDDAIQLKEVLGGETFILVTSHVHMYRAYHTFKKIYKRNHIICSPTNDILKFYGPCMPIGRLFGLLNIYKDFKYNFLKKY